jgi:UDP-3-O-[3-hydroxymyristoyl] N-acetylglucosamine deacetylase
MLWQKTLAQPLNFTGIGLHTGRPVQVTIAPAGANHGLRFVRADLPGKPEILAHYTRVVDTTRATTLGEGGFTLSTVEHLLAALRGLGVDNARIKVEGPELPIMDGSAAPFSRLLREAGLRELSWPRAYVLIRKPVELKQGDQWMRVTPGEPSITYTIDFNHPLIRRQRYSVSLQSEKFCSEIAPARTFGFLKEVQYLQTRGLALGGSLENAVVLDDAGVLNPGGLRFPEECVRHKILDAMGDLALLGLPLLGRLEVGRGSHQLHCAFLQFLMRQENAWRIWAPTPPPRKRQTSWLQAPLWEGAGVPA